MASSAGRVLIMFKGKYDAATTYEQLDCVYYEGGSYVAKKTTTGNEPGENTEYWQMMSPPIQIASKDILGGIRVDEDTIEVDPATGTISAVYKNLGKVTWNQLKGK